MVQMCSTGRARGCLAALQPSNKYPPIGRRGRTCVTTLKEGLLRVSDQGVDTGAVPVSWTARLRFATAPVVVATGVPTDTLTEQATLHQQGLSWLGCCSAPTLQCAQANQGHAACKRLPALQRCSRPAVVW